jgi:hypothetical protein
MTHVIKTDSDNITKKTGTIINTNGGNLRLIWFVPFRLIVLSASDDNYYNN